MDADFRVFYRIDGVGDGQYGGVPAPRFFALAERLPLYDGAVRGMALLRNPTPAGPVPGGGAETVDMVPGVVDNDLAGLVDFG